MRTGRRRTFYKQQLDRRTLDERFTLFGTCEDAIILNNLKLSRFKPRAIPALRDTIFWLQYNIDFCFHFESSLEHFNMPHKDTNERRFTGLMFLGHLTAYVGDQYSCRLSI